MRKKKTLKMLLMAALAAGLMFSLAACGSSGNQGSTQQNYDTPQDEQETAAGDGVLDENDDAGLDEADETSLDEADETDRDNAPGSSDEGTAVSDGSASESDAAENEEPQMYIKATIDGTELVFWQKEAALSWSGSGNIIGDYISFDEDGEEKYELRICLDPETEATTYTRGKDEPNDVAFAVYLHFAPDFSVDDCYGMVNFEASILYNDCSYTVTVTEADALNRHYHGTFSGVMTLHEGSTQLEVTDGEFDLVYGQVSPYYESHGDTSVSAGNADSSGSSSGNSSGSASASSTGGSSSPEACTHCDGSGLCSKCDGSGDTLCSCLGGICGACNGQGHKMLYTADGYEYRTCTTCGGSGIHASCNGTGLLTCTLCDGSGFCTYCNGTGERY